MSMISFLTVGWPVAANFCKQPGSPYLKTTTRLLLIGFTASMVSGCAMTQLGSMFGSSDDEVVASVANPIIAQERSLSMAANEMAPSATIGGAGVCPRISIWKNSAQLTVYEIGRVGDDLAIRHRGEITKTARECEIFPERVTVKFGVAGRILLGPLGKSGRVKLPVLVHITDASSKKIQTSKMDVVVDVATGKLDGRFSSVQSVSFPTEPGMPANQYGVYVTFDKTAPGAG